MAALIKFAELCAKTNYSFLEGASSPEELVKTATALGYEALGVVDKNGVYGVPRCHMAVKSHTAVMALIIGAEIQWKEHPLYLYAQNRNGYGNLCELLSSFHQEKPWELEDHSMDLMAILPITGQHAGLEELRSLFPKRLFWAVSFSQNGQDKERLKLAEFLEKETKIPCLATNEPLFHVPQRKILHDILRSIQHTIPLSQCGFKLLPNTERHLKSKEALGRIFKTHPEWIRETLKAASLCHFSLDEIRYRYPTEWLPSGFTGHTYLEKLVWQGASKRYGPFLCDKITHQIKHELSLIEELGYEDYFLTIWDIVGFARRQNILCQGRGSAANSIVCYLLEITSIDPSRLELLFERFISRERKEPPDIDIDFEHERREEVIQYIYERYGRDRAAITAEVICFRKRSALREVAKALEIDLETLKNTPQAEPYLATATSLAEELYGFPRHLGTHVGGFVLCEEKLSRNIPIEKAGMENRTIVQWDKNDLDNLGFTRVDILGLGILTAIRKCFDAIKTVYHRELTLSTIPAEDEKVYDAICEGDTVGVFQIESRAQMNMLPRLKPRNFFDLIVEISLVRPGPIQGDMVHPYLRRRQGLEKIEYAHPELEKILKKTYGVPLFQEQIMKMAMQVAGFSGGEADELRRAMGVWRRDGKSRLTQMGEKFRQGLMKKGIEKGFSDRIFSQIEGFAEYGFPESHAASFAILVYASSYLKFYYPDAYVTALLNSQPMGFYQSHTLLYDAMRHGVSILPIDVGFSNWDNELLKPKELRLGFREIHGLKEKTARAIEALRKERPFFSLSDFTERLKERLRPISLTKRDLFFLASSGAFQSLGLDRRKAFWEIQGYSLEDSPFFRGEEEPTQLPSEDGWEKISLDFESIGVSLWQHPMRYLRKEVSALGAMDSESLKKTNLKTKVKTAGIVVSRQMPPTANGVLFITLEDEFGFSNLVIWKTITDRVKEVLLSHSFLLVEGRIQKDEKANVTHLIVSGASPLLSAKPQLSLSSHDWG